MTARMFTVVFYSETSITCSSPFSFEFDDDGRAGTIACANWEAITNGIAGHRGLQIDVQVSAPSIKSAVEVASNVAEGLLTTMTLISLGSSGPAKFNVAYDSSDGRREREFWQVFEPTIHGRPVKVADSNAAIDTLEAAGKLGKDQDRVIRAGLSLRRGLQTSDRLSRFSEYWIGLECLNPILQKKLGSEPTFWYCDCGKENKRDEASGVRDFLLKSHGEGVWKRVKDIRRDVFHGTKPIHVIQAEAGELSNALEQALSKATLFCLGAELDSLLASNVTSLPAYDGPRIHLRGILVGEDPKQLSVGDDHPHFELSSEVVEVRQVDDVRHEVMNHRFRPVMGCPFKARSVVTISPKGMIVNHKGAAVLSADGTLRPIGTTAGSEDDHESATDASGQACRNP